MKTCKEFKEEALETMLERKNRKKNRSKNSETVEMEKDPRK